MINWFILFLLATWNTYTLHRTCEQSDLSVESAIVDDILDAVPYSDVRGWHRYTRELVQGARFLTGTNSTSKNNNSQWTGTVRVALNKFATTSRRNVARVLILFWAVRRDWTRPGSCVRHSVLDKWFCFRFLTRCRWCWGSCVPIFQQQTAPAVGNMWNVLFLARTGKEIALFQMVLMWSWVR